MKYAKKHTGKECYLYAVNDEIVWKYDKAKASTIAKTKIAEAKALEEKQAQLDKKPGRFFEDQPDVNDDYQIHFIYMLAADGKDKKLDISGWIEKRIKTVNKKFLEMSAKNKKSNGIGHQFKLDMTKEGKLDVTFVRMNVLKKQLDHLIPGDLSLSLSERKRF
jgi:predicted RecB family nuclease